MGSLPEQHIISASQNEDRTSDDEEPQSQGCICELYCGGSDCS